MTANQHRPEQAATCGLLRAVSVDLGHSVAPEWQDAARAVPRHHFLPERVWLLDGDGYSPCDLRSEPERWYEAAYANAPVVTQVNDGRLPEDEPWPSSSASAPSVVFRMLEELAVEDGMKVLEIGTGTGWNAGLLAHRLGDGQVSSIEVDPEVADSARTHLSTAGRYPEVVCGDGSLGWGIRAPYDRLLATCSVRRVPSAWLRQTRPGGLILTPWDNPWICWGLVRLEVSGGTAEGRFSPHSAFMLMRGQRVDLRIFRDVVRDEHVPVESLSALDPEVVTGEPVAAFAVGMWLADVWRAWQDEPVDGVVRRLWVATTDATSWAAVDVSGNGGFAVYQHGSRRLWDEVEAAHRWWLSNGRPGPARFGLTVAADGSHRVWLDDPGNAWTF
ncbi:methyltransferase [Kitasatospora purpeofusca]|uniref:methyltransferase n=1 Tax=Kitasatospora purpeofusca TaxID=67352 RepID=UPI0036D405A8